MDPQALASSAAPMALDLIFAVGMGYTLYPMPPTLAKYLKSFEFRVAITVLFLLKTQNMLFGYNKLKTSTVVTAAVVALAFQYALTAWAQSDLKKAVVTATQ